MKWSYSTHNTMRRCQRQLVYGQVFASHSSHDPLRREAYVLKQLQHIATWQGSLVHTVLARHFVRETLSPNGPQPRMFLDHLMKLARTQLAYSEAKRYRKPLETKSAAGEAFCGLFEHEYGFPLPSNILAEVANNAASCFQALSGQKDLLALVRSGSQHTVEARLQFRVDEVTVLAIPDLIFVLPDGKIVIVDWKISRSETSDYSRQLLTYALAVLRSGRWPRVQPRGFLLLEANLIKGEVTPHEVTQSSLEETEDFIYRSMLDLRVLIGDVERDAIDFDEFATAGSPRTCQHCNFSRLCRQASSVSSLLVEELATQGRLL